MTDMNPRDAVQAILDAVNARPRKVRVHSPTPEGMLWACYAEDGTAASGVAEAEGYFEVHGVDDHGARVVTTFTFRPESRATRLGEAIRWAVRWSRREDLKGQGARP